MAANSTPSTTPPMNPHPPSGHVSSSVPASSSTPTAPVNAGVPASVTAPAIKGANFWAKLANIWGKKIREIIKKLSGKLLEVVIKLLRRLWKFIKELWGKFWKQKFRIIMSALSLLLTSVILTVILSIFSVSQVFPYTEWLMYRFEHHELALFFFCLLIVSGLCFVYTAQSLLKASLEGKSSGGTAFNLHFGVVFVMVLFSFLGLYVLSRLSTCVVPYVTFQVEGFDYPIHNNERIALEGDKWRKVTAITDQDSYGRLICNWKNTKSNTEISEEQTCTIFVRSTGPDRGIVTLTAHMDVCNTPENTSHLLINGPE